MHEDGAGAGRVGFEDEEGLRRAGLGPLAQLAPRGRDGRGGPAVSAVSARHAADLSFGWLGLWALGSGI